MRKLVEKVCLTCEKDFGVKSCRKDIAKFCSLLCMGKHNEGEGNPFYGKKHTEESKINISKNNARIWLGKIRLNFPKGENNGNWTGEKVEYRGLHHRVTKELGKPHKCEHCGNTKLNHRQYHWANKSRQYKTDLLDWIRLCVRCHKKYDHKVLAQL